VAITEDQRHDLYQSLIEVLGREKATTLMEHLPPLGWADVASKRDLDHQSLVTRRDLELEIGKLRTEMQSGFADVRSEMQSGFADVRSKMLGGLADVRSENRGGLAELREEMHAESASVRSEIAAVEVRFERALREQGRTFFLGMLTANTTLAGVAFAAAQLA
jgi:hypothetical protein